MSKGKSLTSVVIICLFALTAEFSAAESSNDKNLKLEKEYLSRRYDGFYKHSKAYKDYQVVRKKRVLEHKKSRSKYDKDYEVIRKSYKKKKAKIKKKEIDFDALMLKEEKVRLKERKKKRKMYIKRREIMKHLKRTTKRIPEDLDVGLKRLGEKTPKK